MADSKISALTEATSLAATDNFVIATGGATKRVTAATLLATGWIPAGETWTYGTADDPTYTFTISGDLTGKYSAGMRIRVTQATGGTKYAIITKVAYGAPNTTVTAYWGTDYNLENETISSPCYSILKAPYGFPLDPTKWTVTYSDTTRRTQTTPTNETWYNIASQSMSIPLGCWHVSYQMAPWWNDGSSTSANIECAISTGSSSVSDQDLVSVVYSGPVLDCAANVTRFKTLDLTSKTTYYIICRSEYSSPAGLASIGFLNDWSTMFVRAVCAYL